MIPRTPRLEVVKTEVGPVCGELVREEMAHNYEEKEREEDGCARFQLELGLEGNIGGNAFAERRFGRECDEELGVCGG